MANAQLLKDKFRIRITRGVRLSTITQGFATLNPGDVVEVNRDNYVTAIGTGRAEGVDDATPLVRNENYVSERKKNTAEAELRAAKAEIARLEQLVAASGKKPAAASAAA